MIYTPRLLLRQWKEEDFAPFAAMNGDPMVRKYFPKVLTREESDAQARILAENIERLGWGFWAVELIETKEFIGFIGLNEVKFQVPFAPAVEIGWRLAKAHWDKGYATEGARAALTFGFGTLNLEEIVAFCPTGNVRSRSVMEKIGMQRNPEDDFDHPLISEGNPLRRYVLYRIRNASIFSS